MRFEDKIAKLRIQKHGGRETPEFLADVKKMCDGEAIEYLLGQVNFCNAKVDLSLRPMIPRPETEFWVTEAVGLMKQEVGSKKQEGKEIRILDLFSGSGCVGLAILKNISNSHVTFIELAPHLKEQIEISIKENLPAGRQVSFDESRTQVLTGDTFDSFCKVLPCRNEVNPARQDLAENKFDYIFAVPPYVPSQMKDEVMKELTAETPLCFFDKEDGFFYIKKVLSEVRNYLNIRGELFMEFDITQREKIEELVKENNFKNYFFLKDPYGHECVVRVVL